jgi:hypothetical protein
VVGSGKAEGDAKGFGKQIDGTRVEDPRYLYLQVISEWQQQQSTRRIVPAPWKGKRSRDVDSRMPTLSPGVGRLVG